MTKWLFPILTFAAGFLISWLIQFKFEKNNLIQNLKIYPNASSSFVASEFFINDGQFNFKETKTGNRKILNHSEIRRIDFLKKAPSIKKLTKNEKAILGHWSLKVGPYIGKLFFFKSQRTNRLAGYLQFKNWGNGKVEYLRSIQVRQKFIRFVRSCSGASCQSIGASSPFHQTYTGKFANSALSGKYRGDQSSGTWSARK